MNVNQRVFDHVMTFSWLNPKTFKSRGTCLRAFHVYIDWYLICVSPNWELNKIYDDFISSHQMKRCS